MKDWTHKVVKKQRGTQGEWFAYPAATTGNEAHCLAYARRFAEEQRGVAGTRIVVLTRGGKFVREFAVNPQTRAEEIKINVFRQGGAWYGARWIDGEYDGCDSLEIDDAATSEVAIRAAETMVLTVEGPRNVRRVDDV